MYSGRGLPGILLGIFLRRFSCPVSGQLEKNAFRTALIPVRLIHHKCVCQRLGTDLPSGSEFYYANWWFDKDGSPVSDREALPLIGYTSLNEVKLILDVRYYRALHERGMQNSGVRTWVLHFCRRRFSSCFSHLFSFFAMNSLLADQLWP